MVEVLFFLVILFGVFLQSSVGFGTVVTMPLGILLMGMGVTKPVVTFIALLTGITVLITEYRYINWRELLKMSGVMLVGVLAALWVAGRVKMNFLLVVYGAVVVGIGVKKLFFPAKKQTSPAVQNTALAIAGIMQGLFVSGGSFLAVYAVDRMPDKREFRATTNALWAILNTVMLITYFVGGQVDRKILIMGAIAIVRQAHPAADLPEAGLHHPDRFRCGAARLKSIKAVSSRALVPVTMGHSDMSHMT